MHFPLRSLPVGAGTWLLLSAACTTFRPVQPDQLTPPHSAARVWVPRADRSVAVFDSARVEGDSVVGIINGTAERLPLTGATIQTRRLSIGRTAALAGAVAVALTVYLLDRGPPPQAFVCPAATSGPCIDCNKERSVWCEKLSNPS
jgi:hypothetical protein